MREASAEGEIANAAAGRGHGVATQIQESRGKGNGRLPPRSGGGSSGASGATPPWNTDRVADAADATLRTLPSLQGPRRAPVARRESRTPFRGRAHCRK
eukprot:6627659-Alexandrium_andersonii.AAC.1